MNRYICDTCQRQAPPADNYTPPGWFSVSRRYDPERPTLTVPGEQQHFCSSVCAVNYFQATAEADGLRPQVA